jgi:hypothetical protein
MLVVQVSQTTAFSPERETRLFWRQSGFGQGMPSWTLLPGRQGATW